ncbi:MAG: hypothetical protein EHM72_20030, partial [Calditrichaeota bacterium]
MKAFFILLAFALTGSCLAVQMYAVGLDNPGEQWSWFDMNSAEFKLESSFGFSTHTVTVEYKMIPDSWGRYPSGQPFQIVFLINPSDQAIFTGAAVRIDREWVIAEAEDVFAAEEHYDENVQDQPSFLMRDKVRREWDGSERRYVEIRLGPVYYPKSFAFSLTYIDQNQLDINAFLAVFPVSQFNLYRDTSLRMNLLFRDADYPENRPVSLRSYSGNDLVFTKNSSGWWEAKLPSRDGWGDDPLIRWPRPFPLTPELRLFESDGHSFFHLLMLPPLKPADRPTKKVLLLYDLGVKIAHDRGTLFSALQSTAELGLADSDSINVLLMDNLEPVLFYPDFVTATDANIQSLFRRLKDAVIPEISGLPQLLRSAKDYFNKKNTAGELWVFTDAAEHCKAVSGANDILDLSWAKLEVPVEFNIFDCSTYSSDYLTLNGRTYNGNEYL